VGRHDYNIEVRALLDAIRKVITRTAQARVSDIIKRRLTCGEGGPATDWF